MSGGGSALLHDSGSEAIPQTKGNEKKTTVTHDVRGARRKTHLGLKKNILLVSVRARIDLGTYRRDGLEVKYYIARATGNVTYGTRAMPVGTHSVVPCKDGLLGMQPHAADASQGSKRPQRCSDVMP